ncbi:MAG TPA: hybrid sensor histidine kinase/response regulator [Pseudomonadales bacterium]|nr:hybrid sensor histidine kinase/response regulator [Pseudomonadales bacterium]
MITTLQQCLAIFRPNPELDEAQTSSRRFAFGVFGVFYLMPTVSYLLYVLITGQWLLYPGGAIPLFLLGAMLMFVVSIGLLTGVLEDHIIPWMSLLNVVIWSVGAYINGLMSFPLLVIIMLSTRLFVRRWLAWYVFLGLLTVSCLLLYRLPSEDINLAWRYLITFVVSFILLDQMLAHPEWSSKQRAYYVTRRFIHVAITLSVILIAAILLEKTSGSIAANGIFAGLMVVFVVLLRVLPVKYFGWVFASALAAYHTYSFSTAGEHVLPFIFIYLMMGVLVLSQRWFAVFAFVLTYNEFSFLLHREDFTSQYPDVLINLGFTYYLFSLPFVFATWHFLPRFSRAVGTDFYGEQWVRERGPAWLQLFGFGLLVTYLPLAILLNGLPESSDIYRLFNGWMGFFWLLLLSSILAVVALLFVIRNNALAEADKLLQLSLQSDQAKSALLASVNHDIRAPLNSVMSTTQRVLQADDLPAPLDNYFGIIEASGKKLSRLINDMIDIGQLEKGQITLTEDTFSLQEFVRQLRAEHQPMADVLGVTLVMNEAEVPRLSVVGDLLRVSQVVGNLLTNAIKFSPKGEVTLSVSLQGLGVLFTVSDNGEGMDEATMERVFTRFEQADNSLTRQYQGLGLGLNICQDLVALMGGTLHCQSRLGEGSRFDVWIPLTLASRTGSKVSSNTSLEAFALADKRVLVVDDDTTTRLVMSHLLQDHVAAVLLAGSGGEALAMLEKEQVDIVLTDIAMPDMNGVRLFHAIRDRGWSMPVLALTGNALREEITSYEAEGFDAVLAKPVDNILLLNTFHACLLKRGGLQK